MFFEPPADASHPTDSKGSSLRSSTAFVALDERTTEDGFERGQLAQERLAALSQGGCGLFRYFHRTTLTTGLTVASGISFVNSFLQVFSGGGGAGRSASNNATSSKRQSAASRWGGRVNESYGDGSAQSVDSRGTLKVPRSSSRRMSVSTPATRRFLRTSNRRPRNGWKG